MSVSECCEVGSNVINILLLNISNDTIENGQDFAASVTLCEQRENNGLRHNEEEKCNGCAGVVYSLAPSTVRSLMLTMKRVRYSDGDRTATPDHTLLVRVQE